MTHALGVGLSSAADTRELEALVDEVLSGAGVRVDQVTRVGTVRARAEHPELLALCRARGWELVVFDADALDAVAVPHPSERVAELAGTASVAEAAALLLGADLVVGKTSSAHATAALSRTAAT